MTGQWRWVRWVVGLLLAAAVWVQVAPPKWGGRTTFLVVNGTSMLPRFHAGELVAVQSATQHPVGTLAAYRYPALHSVFFHEIVATQGDHYTFQGINNDYPDPFHPTSTNMLGNFWFSVPNGGTWLAFWRQPLHAALLVAAASLVSMTWPSRKRRNKPMRWTKKAPAATTRGPRFLSTMAGALSGLAVVAAVVAAWAYIVPDAIATPQIIPYAQDGHFGYQASVPKSVLYPDGRVSPGNPVAYPPAKTVQVTFTYHLQVPAGRSVGGTVALSTSVVSTSGWSQELPGSSSTTFHGSTVSVAQTINVATLFNTIYEVRKMTNDLSDSYQVVSTASVHAVGMVGSHSILASDAPTLTFVVQPAWLQLAKPTTSSLAAYLNPVRSGSITVVADGANSLAAFGGQIPVSTARLFGPALLGLLGVALLVVLRIQQQAERTMAEPTRIARQYASLLISVDALPFSPSRRSIRVGSMEGLVRLAVQYERIILHAVEENGRHIYLLENTGESYYFSAQENSEANTASSEGYTVGREVVTPP
ncbi:MAG: S24/S26 family peptidase [Thermaerobacter sp.]|nr:S24/S26 family peptidase [Thermaerobacter sp.]